MLRTHGPHVRPFELSTDTEKLEIEDRLALLATEGRSAIDRRLAELDREWHAGRLSRVLLACGILVGLGLGVLLSAWYLLIPAVLALLQLGQGWLPDLRLGFLIGLRNRTDIEHERFALKAIRGDFNHLPSVHDREEETDIARLEGEGGLAGNPIDFTDENRAAIHEVLQIIDKRPSRDAHE